MQKQHVDAEVVFPYKMKTFIDHDFGKLERDTKPDGTRVYKTPSGKSYPSVTTVTSLHNAEGIAKWRLRVGAEEAAKVSSRASARGTRIHSLCEAYLRNEQCEPDIFDKELFGSISLWLEQIDNIHALEDPLYSDHLQIAGTVDCIANFQGKLSVIDFKTASKPKRPEWIKNYFMQCSAYAIMYEELYGEPINRTVVIIGVDDDYPQVFVQTRDDYVDKLLYYRDFYEEKRLTLLSA